MRRARRVPPAERQPLRARARAVLPLRDSSLSSPGAAGAEARRTDSVPRLRASARAPLRGSDRRLPRGANARRARATRSAARSPRRITGSRSRRWPTKSAAACARCAATSGCSASAIPTISRCASAASCSRRAADGSYPDPARAHAGADGPHAQRVERHLLPRHGFSRGRAGAERLDRPRRARARRAAAAAGRGVPARDRRAGAAAGQRRSRRARGHHASRRRSSTSRRITSAC